MVKFSIVAKTFGEMLWNASLYTAKVSVTGGKAKFHILNNQLVTTACDDFVIVREQRSIAEPLQIEESWGMALADIKKLETTLRTVEGTVDVEVTEDQLVVGESSFSIHEVPEAFEALADIVEAEYPPGVVAGDCYVNPARLKNLDRLKISEDSPLAFRPGWILNDQMVWYFEHGPTVRGLIMSMDEETLVKRGVHMLGSDPREAEDPGYLEDEAAEEEIEEPPPWEIEEGPCPHGHVRGDHHWFGCKGISPFEEDDVDRLRGVKAKDRDYSSAIGYRVQYTDAVDVTVAPDHVDKEAFEEYGF